MDSKLGSSEMAGYRVLLSYIFFAICFQNVSITLKLSKAYSAMVLEVFEHFCIEIGMISTLTFWLSTN